MQNYRNLVASFLVVAVAGLVSAVGFNAVSAQQQPAPVAAAATTVAATPTPGGETERGVALYRQGRVKEAVAALRAVVKQTPEDAAAWYYLGQSLYSDGERKDAAKAYEKAVKLRPENVVYRTGRAFALVMMGKAADAQKEAQAALKLDAQNPAAHYVHGLAALASSDFDTALGAADAVVKVDPKFAAAHLLKGDTLIASFGQKYTAKKTPRAAAAALYPMLDDAAQSIETYLRLTPNEPEAELRRAQIVGLRAFAGTSAAADPARPVYREEDTDTPARITDYALPRGVEKVASSGRVMMLATLDADGTVKDVVLLRASHPGLVQPYREAMGRMKFVPAQKGGRAVSQIKLMDLMFGMHVELLRIG
jgi:cytochrome c-type biogenesis protein CcmH/NrfG